MTLFAGQVAVVTGAAGGIGSAISLRLASAGATVCLVGRKPDALEAVAREAERVGGRCLLCPTDLMVSSDVATLRACLEHDPARVDVLIHCAGEHSLGGFTEAGVADLDRLYQINVRGAYAVTSALLPMLKAGRGQIVFLNSSMGLRVRAGGVAHYAASKHALRALADALREEINPDGVRVLSVFLGRTASPMQAATHHAEGRSYRPETLIQPTDVASLVSHVLALPRTAEVTDIHMRPFKKVS
jgi:NADP-dependent 3-hydroxy acid dehydrogenase YdfG